MERLWNIQIFKALSICFCFLACGIEAAEGKAIKKEIPPALCDLPCFWTNIEYLYWEIQNPPEPVPLIVGSSAAFSGNVLNQLGTYVALGGKTVDLGWRSGGRFSAGYRFTAERLWGVEGNYLYLPKISTTTGFDMADTETYFYVPYINGQTGVETSRLIAVPNQYGGPVSLKVSNEMQGAEANVLRNILCRKQGTVDVLAGFKYLNFNEHLTFSTNTPYLESAPNPFVPDIYQTQDRFDTKNNFYGGQIGAKAEGISERFFIQGIGKIALGAICGTVNIHGKFITNDFPDGGATPAIQYAGGYFAQPTNIGSHKKTSFSFIPEAAVNLGYKCCDWLRIQAGYTFIYVWNVLRSGKQIDRTINPTQSSAIQASANPALVGPSRPKALMSTSGLWAQGVSAGIELRY